MKKTRNAKSEDKYKSTRKIIKKDEMKTQITQLASKAKIGIGENQILNEMIKVQTSRLKRNRHSLRKFSSCNRTSRIEVENDLTIDNQDLMSSNKTLRTEGQRLNTRYKRLQGFAKDNLDLLKNELNLLVDRKFIFENALIEKNNYIIKLKNEIQLSLKLPFSREEIREVRSGNLVTDENEMIDKLETTQNELLVYCKSFNKYHNMINNLNKEKEKILFEKQKKNKGHTKIVLTNNYNTLINLNINLSTTTSNRENNFGKNINDNVNINNEINEIVNESEYEIDNNMYINLNNNIINDNMNDNINIDDIENNYKLEPKLSGLPIDDNDSFLNQTITSELLEEDDNNIECAYIKNEKSFIKNSINRKKFKVPVIDLKQIEYNKVKLEMEKSLSREIYDRDHEIDKEINKKRKIIKKLKKIKRQKQKRCKQFEERIRQMESIIKNYSLRKREGGVKPLMVESNKEKPVRMSRLNIDVPKKISQKNVKAVNIGRK